MFKLNSWLRHQTNISSPPPPTRPSSPRAVARGTWGHVGDRADPLIVLEHAGRGDAARYYPLGLPAELRWQWAHDIASALQVAMGSMGLGGC